MTAQSAFCYSENDMASHWKHFSFGLPAVFLSLALLLGGTPVHAQEAAVAPAPADSKPASDADFIAAADEVLGQMSQITGLKVLAPLKKSLRSREEIRAYVIKQMNEEKNPAERYADLRSAEAFGLLPKGFDLDSFMGERADGAGRRALRPQDPRILHRRLEPAGRPAHGHGP
jgi:hypothetical protein